MNPWTEYALFFEHNKCCGLCKYAIRMLVDFDALNFEHGITNRNTDIIEEIRT